MREEKKMNEKGIAPSPWRRDGYGRLYDANGDRIMVNGVSLPAGVHPDSDRADAHRNLLFAAPDLLAACESAMYALAPEASAAERAVVKARVHDAIKKARF
jgi:hypothetical protein